MFRSYKQSNRINLTGILTIILSAGLEFSYGDSVCSPGFEGPLCGRCIDREQNFFSPVSWTCNKCSIWWTYVGLSFLLPVVVVLPLYSYWRLTRRRAVKASPETTDQRPCSYIAYICWKIYRAIVVTMKCIRYLLCCCRVKPPIDSNPKDEAASFECLNYLSEMNDGRKAFEAFATIKLIITSLQVRFFLI